MNTPKTNLGERLIKEGIISYEPVTLRGGEVSNYYADIKRAYGDPELLFEMARATVEDLDEQTTCVAASGYGGIPLAVMVSQLANLQLVLVRDTEKNHGRGGVIDGYMPTPEDVVAIVDDVFTSGSSLRQTMANLASTGATVAGCHVIVARGDTASFGVPVDYLVKADELMESRGE